MSREIILVKLIVVLHYSDPPKGLDYRTKLIKLLSKKTVKQSQAPAFREDFAVEVKDKRIFLKVGINQAGMEINQPKNAEIAINEAVGFFKRLSGLVQWQLFDKIGVRALWINPYKEKFEDLIALHKKNLFVNHKFIQDSEDVGIALTMSDEEKVINFNVGPMEKKQLVSQFLPPTSFDAETLPKVFTFIDYDYSLTKKTDYSNRVIEEFVKHAVQMGTSKAEEAIEALQ